MTGRPIEHVDHIAILVRDADRALPFYRERLRLELVGDERLEHLGVRVVYLDAGNTLLQLVQPTRPGPLLDHLAEHGEGLHHVCFAVADVEAAGGALAPGAALSVAIGGRGRRAAFIPAGPDGLRIELTEVAPWGERAAD